MKIAALQMQAINGDITANLARIAAAAKDAAGQGAKLLIAPELAVTGYGAGEAFPELAAPAAGEITERLERIETGAGEDRDLEVIAHWLRRVTDGSRCYLATEEQQVVSSLLRAFPEEFAEHIENHGCPHPQRRPMPKLVDLVDGTAVYDESFWRKRPDWTYEPE